MEKAIAYVPTPELYHVRNFIAGKWTEPDKEAHHVPVRNPSTGELIGQVPFSSANDSIAAVRAAAAAYDGWRKLPLRRRMKYIFSLREALEVHSEELAVIIATDQGKHISEARGEISRVIEIVETACSIPTLIQGETLQGIGPHINGRVIKSPLGVFCGVAPFNFPALVFAWFVPFAIGVGNTFVFKPSPESPLFMHRIGELLVELGFPPGVVNIVHGNQAVVEAWYERPEVSGICLVGSCSTAKAIAESCGKHGKRAMLLGGAKNFLVAMEDANIDVLVDNVMSSGFGGAGQRCLASTNIAIASEIYDEVAMRLEKESKKLKVGGALEPEIDVGPVISQFAVERIESDIAESINDGARLILDGRRPAVSTMHQSGFFVGPTILGDLHSKMKIVTREVFGPVIGLMKFNDLDEVLDLIKSMSVANGACIFTDNMYYAERFIEEADVGMVGVNVGISAPHPYLPFGGIKDSLIGSNKVQGKAGITFFTQEKVATVRSLPPREKSFLKPARDQRDSLDARDVKSCTS